MTADRHLAQLNVARLRQPLEHPDTAAFVDALDEINALAEASPGFVWRLVDDDGQSSSYVDTGSDDPLAIVNLSVWTDLASLQDFVFRTAHAPFLGRRREWFEPPTQAHTACWWVPFGHRPTVEEAMAALDRLRRDGPDDAIFAFTARRTT